MDLTTLKMAWDIPPGVSKIEFVLLLVSKLRKMKFVNKYPDILFLKNEVDMSWNDNKIINFLEKRISEVENEFGAN
jgi:hypothetical protein